VYRKEPASLKSWPTGVAVAIAVTGNKRLIVSVIHCREVYAAQ